MFGDINRVELMGNITHDLELRHTGKGTPVCSFRIATNRRYQQDGVWKDQTEYISNVLWGTRAESFIKRARKGTRLYIEGRITTRSWEDETGNKRYMTEVVISRLILIDRYEKPERSEGQSASESIPPEPADSNASTDKAKKTTSEKKDNETIDPDDLPF